jgi:hypothetical protein
MQSGAQFIVFLNSDATIVEEDAIRLLDRLRDNPGLTSWGPCSTNIIRTVYGAISAELTLRETA